MRLKHGFKALGLFLLSVLGLMAVGAVGAWATAGELLILDVTQKVATELNATFEAKAASLLVLDVPAINLEIHCVLLNTEKGTYLTGGTGHALILFTACSVYGTNPALVKLSGCEVYPTAKDRSVGLNKGHITAEALLLILNHDGPIDRVLIRAEPTGALFTKIFFKNCAAAAGDVQGGLTFTLEGIEHEHNFIQFFSEAIELYKLDQLEYGVNNANILGSISISLTGEHGSRFWGLC